jgi:spermidine synthase
MYFDYFLPIYYLLDNRENLNILIIGHAGGTISRQYSHFFKDKNIKIKGVELDKEVTNAAYQFFNLAEQKGLEVINVDGRIYLQKTPEKYDLIFIDAYTGDLYIPFQLTTKEFFSLARSKLKENGILAMMIISSKPEKEKLFRGISNTIKAVFPFLYIFPSGSEHEYFALASNLPLGEKLTNLKDITDLNELKNLSSHIGQKFKEITSFEEKYVLTDNKAPVEILREIDNFLYPFY